jgi:hypothetical protein
MEHNGTQMEHNGTQMEHDGTQDVHSKKLENVTNVCSAISYSVEIVA